MAKEISEDPIDSPPVLRVLVLEENSNHANLAVRVLESGGPKVQFEVTDSAEDFQERLEQTDYDVILAGFNLRGWTAFEALEILRNSEKDIPLIVTTESLGDEAAAECIKRGAADFVLKDRPARLPAAVKRALEEKQLRTDKRRAEEALNEERHILLTLMDNLPDGIYFKDRESRFTRINEAQAKLFGLSDPAQVAGKTDFDFFTAEHAQEAYKDELEIIRTGQPILGKEEKETWADGHITWVSSTKMPLPDVSGNVTGTFGISRDITGRKRAEESLRESEERFRATFEDAGIGMALVDMQGHPFKTNAALRQMLGYSEEELARMPFTEFTHPDDREFDSRLYGDLTAGKRDKYETEKRFIKKGGEVVWGRLTVSLVKDRNGRPLCAVGMTQDITESKHAEAALRESEERYRTLFERNLAGVFCTTWDGRILDCNQAMANMMGFASPQEALSHRVSDLFVFDEDRAEFLARLEAEGRLSNFEMRLRRQDGQLVWLMGNISLLPQTATGLRIIEGTLIDITRRKLAEVENARLAQIVNSSDDAIFSSTAEGLIATWNAGAQRMFGYSAEEIKGRHFTILIPEDRRGRVAEDRARLLRGEALLHHEIEHVRKDGSVFPVLLTLSPIKDDKGTVTGVSVIARDITERKRAEEELLLKTALLEAQSETTIDGILVVDLEDQILLVNKRFGIMWNLPDDLLSTKDDSKMIEHVSLQVKDTVGFIEKVRYLNSHPTEESRDELELKNGRVFDRFSSPLQGPAGKLYGRIWYFRDITENKGAESKLRASEVRYRRLFETAHDGILILDADSGEIRDVNPFLTELLGFSQDELLGKKLWEIGPLRDVLLSKIGFEELQTKGYIRYEDLPLQTRDGKNVAVEFVSNVYVAGHQKVIQCNIRDITERKRAEAERVRLVAAIEQSSEAVVITNPRGDIEYVNPAFTRITGYNREEALGQNLRILKSNRQAPDYYQQLWETLLEGKPWQGELINQRKDGSHYTEQMSISPVKDAHGEVTYFIATKEDVTERRTLEAQLQQATKMEAVGRLAGGVAHDFNNLLTVINGYSEILLGRLASDEKASAYLQEINNAGERAAVLTRQLLAFSRRQVLAPQVLDLNSVVSNLDKMLRRLIGEDVKLRTVLDSSLERVKADPGQIEQILMNLAVNSRDAMPMGGNLTIETRNVELDEEYRHNHASVKPGPHVMLAVSDTGAGMSPEIQAHIFEPFFTTKEQGKGTGLGLATVYGIVKQSEGSIWLYSEVGQGTVFKVYFPVATESSAEKEPGKVATDSASGTETILVVEDEEGVRSLVRLALSSGGYHVLETKDAESAVALCAGHSGPIHLLLTDVVMPQMSGPAVAAKVAALRPAIKVLYMSGYTDDAIVHHGVLSNEVPFIQKPFSPLALRKKVREVLRGREKGEMADA